MAALLGVGLLAAGASWAAPGRSIYPPPAQAGLDAPANSVISPSGKWLAFVATDSLGAAHLWVRSLESGRARPLPATQGASFPFWSPDEGAIGFFARGKLRAISRDGTGARILADAKHGHGGAWSPSGAIVFAPDDEGPIVRVDAQGGRPVAVTRSAAPLDTSDHHGSAGGEERGEAGDRMPCFLPDGEHFLYQEYPDEQGLYRVMVGSLQGGEGKQVLLAGSAALYAAPGYLIFSRLQVLMAQKWDPASLSVTGPEIPLGHVAPDPDAEGAPRVSVSARGALAYSNRASSRTLEWFSKDGRSLGALPVQPGPYVAVVPSPDSRRAVLVRFVSSGLTDLWVADLHTGAASRLTHEKGMEKAPRWTVDGRRIVFRSNRDGRWRTYATAADGSGTEQLLAARAPALANVVPPDGRELRLVPVPHQLAGHTVVRDWTSLLSP